MTPKTERSLALEQLRQKTKKITTMGMLLAMVAVLSYLEHQLPPLPPPFPPGMRLGISNVIVMYTLFFMGRKYGYLMAVLKSLFVLLSRSPEAAFMSLFGGLLSVTVIVLLDLIFRSHISYLLLSIGGAIGHNIGQMCAASLQFQTNLVAAFLPLLLISGVMFGTLTGVVLSTVMPLFHQITGIAPQRYRKNPQNPDPEERDGIDS